MSKRSRSDYSAADGFAPYARRGRHTGASMYPAADWGRTYSGPTDATLARYGAQYASASADQRAARAADKYYGRGLYSSRSYGGRGLYSGRGGFFGDIGKWAGRGIGSIFGKRGKRIGGRIGSSLGDLVPVDKVQKAALKYAGLGTYTANSLVRGVGDTRPSMDVIGGGDNQTLVVSHKEYLQDVYGPENSGFSSFQTLINPGLATNFPWLAQIAANYEEYEFSQLIFEFHSTVDPASTDNPNGATGTIVMATNYNPDAPPFESKEVMMQYHGANSGRLTDDMVHGVECDPSKNAGAPIKFVRTMTPSGGQSLKGFDLGNFQWALVNLPTAYFNSQVGELWVHYTVKCSKPRLYSGVYRSLPLQSWSMPAPGLNTPICPLVNGTGVGAGGASVVGNWLNSVNSLGVLLDHVGSLDNFSVFNFTFPDFMTGSFSVELYIQAAAGASNAWLTALPGALGPTFGGNVSLINDIPLATDPITFDNSEFVSVAGTVAPSVVAQRLSYTGHIRVEPATATTNNTYQFTIRFTTSGTLIPSFSQVYLKVFPYNKLESDKYTSAATGLIVN